MLMQAIVLVRLGAYFKLSREGTFVVMAVFVAGYLVAERFLVFVDENAQV